MSLFPTGSTVKLPLAGRACYGVVLSTPDALNEITVAIFGEARTVCINERYCTKPTIQEQEELLGVLDAKLPPPIREDTGETAKARRILKWDMRYLGLARYIAGEWSKDPSTKTGAVITTPEYKPVSLGYNGFPEGVDDTEARLTNRDLKYPLTVHCEVNAQIFAQRNLHGCYLFTWPFMSCTPCAVQMIACGIKRVVAPQSTNPRWLESFKLSMTAFAEAGVEVKLYSSEELAKAGLALEA